MRVAAFAVLLPLALGSLVWAWRAWPGRHRLGPRPPPAGGPGGTRGDRRRRRAPAGHRARHPGPGLAVHLRRMGVHPGGPLAAGAPCWRRSALLRAEPRPQPERRLRLLDRRAAHRGLRSELRADEPPRHDARSDPPRLPRRLGGDGAPGDLGCGARSRRLPARRGLRRLLRSVAGGTDAGRRLDARQPRRDRPGPGRAPFRRARPVPAGAAGDRPRGASRVAGLVCTYPEFLLPRSSRPPRSARSSSWRWTVAGLGVPRRRFTRSRLGAVVVLALAPVGLVRAVDYLGEPAGRWRLGRRAAARWLTADNGGAWTFGVVHLYELQRWSLLGSAHARWRSRCRSRSRAPGGRLSARGMAPSRVRPRHPWPSRSRSGSGRTTPTRAGGASTASGSRSRSCCPSSASGSPWRSPACCRPGARAIAAAGSLRGAVGAGLAAAGALVRADAELVQAVVESPAVVSAPLREVGECVAELPPGSGVLPGGRRRQRAQEYTVPAFYYFSRGGGRRVLFDAQWPATQYLLSPSPRKAYYRPDYAFVLTGFPGLASGRRPVARRGPTPCRSARRGRRGGEDRIRPGPGEGSRAIPWVSSPFELWVASPEATRFRLRIGLRRPDGGGDPAAERRAGGTLPTVPRTADGICAMVDARAGRTVLRAEPVLAVPPAPGVRPPRAIRAATGQGPRRDGADRRWRAVRRAPAPPVRGRVVPRWSWIRPGAASTGWATARVLDGRASRGPRRPSVRLSFGPARFSRPNECGCCSRAAAGDCVVELESLAAAVGHGARRHRAGPPAARSPSRARNPRPLWPPGPARARRRRQPASRHAIVMKGSRAADRTRQEPLRLLERLRRADLVEALAHRYPASRPAQRPGGVDVGEVGLVAVEGAGRQRQQPVVDPLGARRGRACRSATRPPSKAALLVSQRPWLRSTVIRPAQPRALVARRPRPRSRSAGRCRRRARGTRRRAGAAPAARRPRCRSAPGRRRSSSIDRPKRRRRRARLDRSPR